MLTANELRNTIVSGLPCDHVEVLGDDGQHFEAVIVSTRFSGKSRIQQHQLVYRNRLDPTTITRVLPAGTREFVGV